MANAPEAGKTRMRTAFFTRADWIYENSANKLRQITREWVSEYFIYSRILE